MFLKEKQRTKDSIQPLDGNLNHILKSKLSNPRYSYFFKRFYRYVNININRITERNLKFNLARTFTSQFHSYWD